VGQYEIWELTSNQNRYIEPLQFEPVLYTGNKPWKEVAHRWFTRDELLDTHLVFDKAPEAGTKGPIKMATDSLAEISKKQIDIADCQLSETINNDEILLETSCPGKPHLIKVSYHPNWRVQGADKIYLASPSFMLIYPTGNNVVLSYGPGPWNRLGQLLTLAGLIILLINIPLPGTEKKSAWNYIANRMAIPNTENLSLPVDPSPKTRKIILVVVLVSAAALATAVSYHTYTREPYRAYKKSIQYKDTKEYEKARQGFRSFLQKYPLANLAQESSYYIAITYFLENKNTDAINAFEEYLKLFPKGRRSAESHYHIGLIQLRTGLQEQGFSRMQLIIEKYLKSPWARYASERLLEYGFTPEGEKVNINSSNLDYYMGRAISYFNQDKLDEARPILLQISKYFPDFEGTPQALAALALSYYKTGNCESTIKYYQDMVQRYPAHKLAAEAYFHIGICHNKNNNSGPAKDAFKKVIENFPDSIYAKQASGMLIQYRQ
jgi:TolA-binding protein